VIYTLIGLAIIGLVLAFANPWIKEKKDDMLIKQAIKSMSIIDSTIREVTVAQGNQRIVSLALEKGTLNIDTDNDKINWVLDSSFKFSEPGVSIPSGTLTVLTEENQGWKVNVFKNYENIDIQFGDKITGVEQISASKNSKYTITIANAGLNTAANKVIVKITKD
jgi:type II secretory pathway pseudopilin PulG